MSSTSLGYRENAFRDDEGDDDDESDPLYPLRGTSNKNNYLATLNDESEIAVEENVYESAISKQQRYSNDERRNKGMANMNRSRLFIVLFMFLLSISLTIFFVERKESVAVSYDDRQGDDYITIHKDDDDDDDDGDDYDYSGDGSLTLYVSNSYGATKGSTSLKYPFLDGDNQLFEPYKEHTVKLYNIDSDFQYSYEILDSSGSEVVSGEMLTATKTHKGTGYAYFTATLEAVGEYALTIREYSSASGNSTVSQQMSSTVHCKYIRREITSLSDDDREEFLDALYTLWSTNTLDGKEMYGERYKSLYYLATVHMDAGANPVCDEFHSQSGGFMNNHVMLNQYLEQSLQLVNPKVALHYLEYPKYFTEDYDDSFWTEHMSNTLDGGSWCELLSDKYFGSNDPYTGELVDSRWAGATIPLMDDQFFVDHDIPTNETFFPDEEVGILAAGAPYHLVSPVGLLRSPWNFNPSRKITRFNNVNQLSGDDVDLGVYNFYEGVDCDDWTTFALTVKGQDLMDFMAYMEDDAHGKIHFTFGGSGGDSVVAVDEQLRDDYGFDDDDLVVTAQYTQTLVKLRYAHYNWEFSESNYKQMAFTCNSTSFMCELNPWFLDGEDEARIDLFFTDTFYRTVNEGTPQYDVVEKVLALDSFDEKVAVANLLISRFQYDGDMAGASAAVDPLFWIVHASMEKLYQKMREQYLFSSVEYYSVDGHSCSGHNPDGTKYWLKGFYMMNESVDASSVTNAEWVEYLNPMNDLYRENFKFVYDNFDYGAWCSDLEEAIGG